MKRRITAWLAGATLIIATAIGVAAPAAQAYGPGDVYAQEALARDYAWMGYYQKHRNWAAYQAEQAKIAHEERHLHRSITSSIITTTVSITTTRPDGLISSAASAS